MLKFTSSALGLLTIVIIAPSSPAALQNQQSLPKIDRELHVQRLAPIKNSVRLRTIVGEKNTPTSKIEVPRLNEVERQQEIDRRTYEDARRQPKFPPPLDPKQPHKWWHLVKSRMCDSAKVSSRLGLQAELSPKRLETTLDISLPSRT
jgi:hypothetical protein